MKGTDDSGGMSLKPLSHRTTGHVTVGVHHSQLLDPVEFNPTAAHQLGLQSVTAVVGSAQDLWSKETKGEEGNYEKNWLHV